VTEPTTRERDPAAKRARIAGVALDLFQSQGYAETTIDQIAEAANVGRRTVFHHFASKEAILFDHLMWQREAILERVAARPTSEPLLVSLHAVFRELAQRGFDRPMLEQIRAVLRTEPRLAVEQLSAGSFAWENKLLATLSESRGADYSALEIHAVTAMACGWFLAAVRVHLIQGRPTLLRCFDDVVATCIREGGVHLGPTNPPLCEQESRARR
jgi:AcrR family transcriptional regulator